MANTNNTNQIKFDLKMINDVITRLTDNKSVRLQLPENGILNIDRQLPFLLVYRQPEERVDYGTEKLIQGEASYLIVSAKEKYLKATRMLLTKLSAHLAEMLGAFLIIEVWSAGEDHYRKKHHGVETGPHFRILGKEDYVNNAILSSFRKRFAKIHLYKHPAELDVKRYSRVYPPGAKDIFVPPGNSNNVYFVGIEVEPIYRDPDDKQSYPLTLEPLQRSLTRALKQVFYDFVNKNTLQSPPHFYSLGKQALVKAVWDVDKALAEIGNSFDLLLNITPVNGTKAFNRFKRMKFQEEPKFEYAPRPIEPTRLKYGLYKISLEKIEDPILSHLFREKQDELDRQITLIIDRGTKKFLYGSMQLWGGVSNSLYELAKTILETVPPSARESHPRNLVSAEEFALHARREIAIYKEMNPDFDATVELGPGLGSLMVSKNRLIIGEGFTAPRSRITPLLHHEVGTHLLTYFNGKAQPFKQLYAGLPGYDETQEGLAVLAEYLSGGLSLPRMRILAARVVAVKSMIDGATFVDTFRILKYKYGISEKISFVICKRVYRGGGLTKDAVYLNGLVKLISYLKKYSDLTPLFIGKINTKHIPVVRELKWREIVKEPKVIPRYITEPETEARLKKILEASSILELIERRR
ncbi:MAG: flavohemoglobin expression-modulating QEGLA motif protein [Acidobacteria bacterium]|nr:flavohemoglobin expression-modulating QEGLA motif protein [Acidobacteriota bacterium]